MTREREASRQGSKAGHLAGKNQLLGLVFCHHPATSCVTLQLVRPVGKSGACCLRTGVSLRVEEGVFLGSVPVWRDLEQLLLAAFGGAEGEETTGPRLASSQSQPSVRNPDVSLADSGGCCET